jgi:hypothetical protein|tara:strand:- start:245 stop:502 length:258 start_codon:yes stop_codon:yes gene_type:complete
VKYVLVNKLDEIEWSQELASNIGISGAKTYFRGIKRIDEKSFDRLWKVMTQSDYDRNYEASLRTPSSEHIRWWEDIGEKSDLDEW